MSYWLLDWLESEGLREKDVELSVAEVRLLMRDDGAFQRMLEFADSARSSPPADVPASSTKTLVTSTGLDLSGILACRRPRCMVDTVDQLISRTWFFFDKIVAVGLDPADLFDDLEYSGRARVKENVIDHSSVVLYLNSIGATDFFEFRRQPRYCTHHLNEHAHEAGISVSVEDLASALTDELSRGGSLKLRETRIGLEYTFSHPLLEFMSTGTVGRRAAKPALMRRVAAEEANRLVARLTTSISLARNLNATLGQSALRSSKTLPLPNAGTPRVADVALNLDIPMIHNVPPGDLLTLRRTEPLEFTAFRSALSSAIEKRIALMPEDPAPSVANSVVDDILIPEIAKLGRQMEKSSNALTRRSTAVVAASGIVTTIGLMSFAPLVVPGLILAAGGGVAVYNDYIKDAREVEMSDLYFLWRMGSGHG